MVVFCIRYILLHPLLCSVRLLLVGACTRVVAIQWLAEGRLFLLLVVSMNDAIFIRLLERMYFVL